jgi:hypothetical protein
MRKILQLAAAQTVIIDCLQGETFLIRMVTSIENLIINNISPGQLYVFFLSQDVVGGRSVTWGTMALNGTALDPAPHSVTVVTFIGQPGNYMQANLPGSWAGQSSQSVKDGKKRWRPQRLAQLK